MKHAKIQRPHIGTDLAAAVARVQAIPHLRLRRGNLKRDHAAPLHQRIGDHPARFIAQFGAQWTPVHPRPRLNVAHQRTLSIVRIDDEFGVILHPTKRFVAG